jgi:hypothetical protein
VGGLIHRTLLRLPTHITTMAKELWANGTAAQWRSALESYESALNDKDFLREALLVHPKTKELKSVMSSRID